MALSATRVRTVQATGKTQKIYDGGGMFLEVTPKGAKRWRIRFRYAGKENTLSLGLFPAVSLKDARARRDEIKRQLAKGLNPSELRRSAKRQQADRDADSFERVAREWHGTKSSNWSDSYRKRALSRLERDIFPWLGQKPVGDIAAPEVLAAIRRIEQRNAIESAHRTLRLCGQVFRYAVSTGRAERDPTGDLRGALTPIKKGHMAAITNPKKVGELMRAIDEFDGRLIVRCALRLAPLVFVRPGELRSAKWAYIDLDKAEWRFQVSKTKTEHIVPLARQAIAILGEINPLTCDSEYVFPNARSDLRPMSDVALLAALRRLGFSKKEMSVHGFRAMARTLLDEELGYRADFIEHQLAHAVRDPNGRAYNRTKFLPERREMMQSWANYLDQLRDGSQVVAAEPAMAGGSV